MTQEESKAKGPESRYFELGKLDTNPEQVQPVTVDTAEQSITVGEVIRSMIVDRRVAMRKGQFNKAAMTTMSMLEAVSGLMSADLVLASIARMEGVSEGLQQNITDFKEGKKLSRPISTPLGMLDHMLSHILNAKDAVTAADWEEVANQLASLSSECEDMFEAHSDEIYAASGQEKPEPDPAQYVDQYGNVYTMKSWDKVFVVDNEAYVRLMPVELARDRFKAIDKAIEEPTEEKAMMVSVPTKPESEFGASPAGEVIVRLVIENGEWVKAPDDQ